MTATEDRYAARSWLSRWKTNLESFLAAKRIWVEYVVVALILCISGNYAFNLCGHPRTALLITACLFGLLLPIYQVPSVSLRLCIASMSFGVILLIQSIAFSFFPTITIAGFFVRLFIGYAAFRLVRDFPRVYINVMCGVVILSLCFYIPEQLCHAFEVDFQSFFHGLRSPEAQHDFHLVVHNFHYDSVSYRNSAFFWEPGAFAGYLLVALIFLGLVKEQFKARSHWRRVVVLFVGLLTTFSTTGYALVPLALLLHFRLDGRGKTVAIRSFMVFYALALLVEGVTYRSVVGRWPVKDKVVQQYTDAVHNDGGRYSDRFDNLAADLEYIRRRPILGWGLNSKTRYMLHPGQEYGSGHGEGLTDFIVKFGLMGLGIFTLCVWTGFMQVSGQNALMSSLAASLIVLILNGECFLKFPLFLGLMFLEPGQPQTGTHHCKTDSLWL